MMLLWIDLETTGLYPDEGEILEVGWFITDNWEVINEAKSALVTPTKQTFELMKNDFVVSTMHRENGLAADLVLSEYTRVLEDIEDEILDDLADARGEGVDNYWATLAGASVHFDRKWIEEYMPRLDLMLNYRHFDVSTLKMFFDSMGFYKLGERDTPSNHRALDDVKDSYKLARKYVNLINMMVDEGESNAERKPF
jgi:oligoribonuclease